MIAGNGDDEARIFSIGLVEALAVLVDVAGKVDHVAQMIEERGHHGLRACVVVVRHHPGDEVHLLAALVARIADAVEHQLAGLRDLLDLLGMQQMRQIEAERRLPVGRRQALEREMLRHEFRLLDRQRRAGAMRLVPGMLVRDIAVRGMTMCGMHVAGLLMSIPGATILAEAMPAHCSLRRLMFSNRICQVSRPAA